MSGSPYITLIRLLYQKYCRLVWLAAGAASLIAIAVFGGPQIWAYWPYAFLLACPLMHIFMHKGHGSGHSGHGGGCCGGGHGSQKGEQEEETHNAKL